MTWELTAGSAVGGVAAGIAGFVALYAWRNRTDRLGLPFLGLALALAVWPLLYAIQLGFDTLPEQLLLQRLAIGIAGFVPTLCLIFVFAYTRRESLVSRRATALFLTEPIAFLALCLTNPYHGLIWTGVELTTTPLGAVPVLEFGPGYLVHITYAYLAVGIGLGLLVMYGTKIAPMYQKQVALLLIGAMPAFVAHIAYTLQVVPIPWLDLTPFLFAFTSVVFGLALFRFQLLRLAPIARDQSLEKVGDGLVVLNDRGDIVDLFGVAPTILEPTPAVGDSIEQVFPDRVIEDLDGTELVAVVDGKRQVYELQVSELTDQADVPVGSTLILRDVTGLRESEQRLSVSNRVLRHNLRNEMNVVLGHVKQLEQKLDGVEAEQAHTIRESVETFMELAEKARTITQLDSLPEGRETTVDLVEHLAGLVRELDREFPTVDVSFDAPDEALVEDIDPETVDLAFRNVIDNAARHNVNDDPHVAVSITLENGTVVVEIADNGPGLPEIERRTLESGVETSLEHSQGLGLWLTYWCVSLWGGDLSIESGSDGTTVTISIPQEAGETTIESIEPVA